MGTVNKLSTKLEASSTTGDSYSRSHEIQILESLSDIKGKVNTNDLAIRAGSKLRLLAIKDSTYDDLRDLACQSNNRETFDGIIRKCVEAYKNKKK
jgi:hypothetical protein